MTATYLPDQFRVKDHQKVHALMFARPFARLVSGSSTGLIATHLPTVLKNVGQFGVIEGHAMKPRSAMIPPAAKNAVNTAMLLGSVSDVVGMS